MEKYECTICDYIYRPELGDTVQSIEPGTDFGDLPETWLCPNCGAAKDAFQLEEERQG